MTAWAKQTREPSALISHESMKIIFRLNPPLQTLLLTFSIRTPPEASRLVGLFPALWLFHIGLHPGNRRRAEESDEEWRDTASNERRAARTRHGARGQAKRGIRYGRDY
uniref:Uncharacterized protein n=1 Tax=Oryza sativa subsp. japonica TaxID=39947 RepID=Q654T5_ORYSJ|nr:hypothetical protein [Oryza sativa Japonica Group]